MAITKYDKAAKDALGKNTYYLSLSALQKCVRRGDAVRAINFAKVAWRMEPYRLFTRLWTILYEDCGRDVPVLLAFYKYRGGYSKFEGLIPLIQALADAKKSRDAGLLSSWITAKNLRPDILWNAIKGTKHERISTLIQQWPNHKFDAYDVWDFGVGDSNFDWTIELADRAQQWDREGLYVGSPYFFMLDMFELSGPVVDEAEPCTLWNEWFPLESMDCHTRPGGHAIGTLLKYKREWVEKLGLRSDRKAMEWYLFFCEGWMYRNYQPYQSLDAFKLHRDMECQGAEGIQFNGRHVTVDIEVVQSEILPEMNKVRDWLLNNVYGTEMSKLKVAFFDEHLVGVPSASLV